MSRYIVAAAAELRLYFEPSRAPQKHAHVRFGANVAGNRVLVTLVQGSCVAKRTRWPLSQRLRTRRPA
jgi:hypothetical protein